MSASEVQQFCDYMTRQIVEISKIDNRLFQKILFVSLLDTMGRAKFPHCNNNHDRMVRFIDECSSWEDRNRVSLVQLSLLKTGQIHPQSPLLALIANQTASWQDGSAPRSNADPLISGIVLQTGEAEIVNHARYAELFYHYRNTLIHEFREPGYPMEVSSDGSSPYYFSMNKQWELVFPTVFFKMLCESCLNGLRAYLIKEDIDPYTRYQFGRLWIQKKNKLKKIQGTLTGK